MATSFDFKKRLGTGHFGEVWLAVDVALGVQVALKCIPPDKIINKHNFFHEAQILKTAQHPNIIKVNDTGILKDDRVYVSMEYLAKGSLEDETRGAYVPLTRAKRIMVDVLRGLECAHSRGIIHRDIKPGNILVGDSLEGQLSDFGLAVKDIQSLNTEAINEKYGYVLHLAPEVNSIKDYSVLSDIYACGVTLYRLVNGDSYLPSMSPIVAREATKSGQFPNRESYRDFIPRSLKAIINKAMEVTPSKRFRSAQEMRRSLEQLKINMNWSETILPDGIKWTSGWKNRCYEVRRIEAKNGIYDLYVRKGKTKHSLRLISELCKKKIKKAEAEVKTRRILQGFVNGKLV
jgi:serine/threonine protein kinase